ncbi:MAG TPA: hypothetical protein VK140_14380 [Ktedonobacteraceae bacterium]|nr:hypothetical protein [Ktedonobacteraceae bacterium]
MHHILPSTRFLPDDNRERTRTICPARSMAFDPGSPSAGSPMIQGSTMELLSTGPRRAGVSGNSRQMHPPKERSARQAKTEIGAKNRNT